jgi:hypothetical protein
MMQVIQRDHINKRRRVVVPVTMSMLWLCWRRRQWCRYRYCNPYTGRSYKQEVLHCKGNRSGYAVSMHQGTTSQMTSSVRSEDCWSFGSDLNTVKMKRHLQHCCKILSELFCKLLLKIRTIPPKKVRPLLNKCLKMPVLTIKFFF